MDLIYDIAIVFLIICGLLVALGLTVMLISVFIACVIDLFKDSENKPYEDN